jgi:hypothetical protein
MSLPLNTEEYFIFTPPTGPQVISLTSGGAGISTITALNPVISHQNPSTPWWSPAGSGGGSASSFNTLTVSSIVSVGPPGEILVYTDASTKLKTSVDAGTSTIREVMTNGSGTQVTPALVFQPSTNSFIIQDTSNNKSLLIATNGQDLSLPGTVNISSIAMPANPTITFGTTLSVGRSGDSLTMDLSQNGNDNVSLALTTPNNDNTITVGADGGAGKITVATGPLQIFASDLAVYSSITTFNLGVSSINGAGVGDAPSTLGFSAANFPGGAGTVPLGGAPFAMTDSFAVDTAHRYRVSFEAAYTNTDATGPNYTTAYISGTSPTMYITTIDNRDAIPAMNDLRGSVASVFVPNSSPCQIITANSSALANTGMTVNAVAGVVLEDLGPA